MQSLENIKKAHTDQAISILLDDIKNCLGSEMDPLALAARTMFEMDCKICEMHGHSAVACWFNLELYHQTKPYSARFLAYNQYRMALKTSTRPNMSASSVRSKFR